MNSDAINRKLYRFTVGALEDGIYNNALVGIPALLGHDGLRPIGWNYPFGLFLEPKLSRLVGIYQLAETGTEQAMITKAYKAALVRRYREECEPHREELDNYLKEHISPSGRYMGLGCAAYCDPGILSKVYPKLESKLDKDGLIYLTDLLSEFEYLGQGIFKDKNRNLAIFCHSSFRRNLSHINNFHFDFIEKFMSLHKQPDVTLRVALDRDVIGLASSFHRREELDYWWGPQYSDEIANIPLGVTHFECDENQKFYSGISGSQFWWKQDDNLKTFEAEELRDEPTGGQKTKHYGCRYVHSIYDVIKNEFVHFDGAIRTYPGDDMIERIGKKINESGKNTIYTKLFRIDGRLKLSDWKALVTLYYQGNPLIYEYFGVKQEHENLFKSKKDTIEKSILEKYVPYSIDAHSGVRLFLSYHTPSKVTSKFDRIIINPDTLTTGDKKRQAVEFMALEVKKALNRIGEELTIPSKIVFINTFDRYINFPTILHSNIDTTEKLQGTVHAFKNLFNAFKKKDSTVSMTLAWPLNDREVRLSIYGKLPNVLVWLNENGNIPTEYAEFRKWVEAQNIWLSKNYEPRIDKPALGELVNGDGVIFCRRVVIDESWVEFKENELGQLTCTLMIPEGFDEVLNALNDGTINPAAYYVVKKARCSKTGGSYFTSKTSRILDNDVAAIIEKVSRPTPFWTDQPLFDTQ
jgi:hypothetical protein